MNEAIVVLSITIFAFVFAKQYVTNAGSERSDYVGRCTVWLLISFAAFIFGSFWLFAALTCSLLAFYSRKDSNPLALFCFLLFAVPDVQMVLPGPGPIDALVELSYYRMLALFVLLPVAWREFSTSSEKRSHMRLPDTLVALLLILTVGASAIDSGSLTISLRMTVYAFTDVILPYYVASRYITKVDQFYDIAAAFVAALFVASLIAIFESSRTWLLYEALKFKWADVVFQGFQMRGILRATAAAASPITLGFSMVVGLGFGYLLRSESDRKWQNFVIMVALLGGLLATVSRGPWVGAVALIGALAILGPGKLKRLSLFAVAAAVTTIILLLSPYGDAFISYLPWIGAGDDHTITFRETLLLDSLAVISENPFFGDQNFASHPLMIAQARMNGDFLDIANAYLGYALLYGLFAMVLFVLVLCSSLLRLRAIVKTGVTNAHGLAGPARVLFGIIFAMAVILGTASLSSEMEAMIWVMVGLASALFRMSQQDPVMVYGGRLRRTQTT